MPKDVDHDRYVDDMFILNDFDHLVRITIVQPKVATRHPPSVALRIKRSAV